MKRLFLIFITFLLLSLPAYGAWESSGAWDSSRLLGSINVIPDDGWIGLGAAKCRSVYNDDTIDELNLVDCFVQIGDGTFSWGNVSAVGDVGIEGKLEVKGTVYFATVLNISPSAEDSQKIINIVPSTPLTTASAEWDGLFVDGSLLDPSAAATDVSIHGVHIDMSGVSRTYFPEVEAHHAEATSAANIAGQYQPGVAYHADGKIRIDYDATQLAADRSMTALDIVIDTTGVSAGEVHAVDVATAGGGTGGFVAVGTHPGVEVIHQHTGTFASPGANFAGEQTGGGVTWDDNLDGETIFVANNDTILVGSSSTFDEIEVILGTVATKDIFPRFYYNTAVDTWVRFFPEDDTQGMMQSGSIRFDNPAGWTADGDPDAGGAEADAGYWIKIERNRVATPGTIVITTAKILSATEYSWDKTGNLLVASLNTTGTITGLVNSTVLTNTEGVHDGGNNVAIMADSGESFATSAYVGMTIYNTSDGSSCTVTANDGTTITCTLSGGTDNDWDTNDTWAVAPGPRQSGSLFYIGSATTILHPATANYVAGYYSTGANVIKIDPQSGSMQITLNGTPTGTNGEEVDSSGAAGDFIWIHNQSATVAVTQGRSGLFIDGGAS